MTRRGALLLAAAALPWPSLRPAPARAAPAVTTVEVAPGLHVRPGVHEDATPENRDAIANIGFVVGDASVAVIDPGGSRDDGEALRARIRAVTPLPVRHVIMTHLHPDHVFGAVAFADDTPVFVAHARMRGQFVARGEYYRNRLADVLGLEEAGDYAAPGLWVEERAEIDLGGRVLDVRAHPTAHTDHDLSVFDRQTATLWAGDLLFVERVPALDGSLLGWLRELDALKRVPAVRAVPGHGPASVPWPAGAADQERYLRALAQETRAIIARGGSIEEAVETVGRGERGRWALFDDYNGRNATAAFKELEWE